MNVNNIIIKTSSVLLLTAMILTSPLSFAGKKHLESNTSGGAASATAVQSSSVRSLPKKSITVGCNRTACEMNGGNGRLMYGLGKDSVLILTQFLDKPTTPANVKINLQSMIAQLNQLQERMKVHNHAGVTVDIIEKAPGIQGFHLKKDWFDLDLNENSYEAIFFEQLPPTGVISSRGAQDHSNASHSFLPRAIEKARKALTDDGKMIIQLALDSKINSNWSKEDLTTLRATNPFIGSFNDVRQALYVSLQSNGTTGPESIKKAIAFYVEKMNQKSRIAIREAKSLTTDMKQFTESTLNSIFSNFTNLRQVTLADINDPNRKDIYDIVSTIYKLMLVFKQQDMMIDYMNGHGFKNAKLEWLEAGEHQFNPAAGWFLTATKDASYTADDDEASATADAAGAAAS